MKQTRLWAAAMCLCMAASWCAGDTILIGGGRGANGLVVKGRIQKIENGQIVYITDTGSSGSKALERVTKILVDGNPTQNEAEEAFLAEKWAEAAEGYQKIVKSGDTGWLGQWASRRLAEAAPKSNRFDLSVLGWAQTVLASNSPESVNRPSLPDAGSKYLDIAIKTLNDAANTPKITDERQFAILSFLLDIYQAKNDNAALAKVYAEVQKLKDRPGSKIDPGQLVGVTLTLAKVALSEKNYAKALSDLEASKGVISDPAQQADALYLIAEAKNGLLPANAEASAVKDVALAYVRVVAHFKDSAEKQAIVADSLVKAGSLHERLGEPQSAVLLYRDAAEKYSDTPAAKTAREKLEQLKDK